MGMGSRLRELRKNKDMKLKEVGEHLGLTATAISCYESETRKPSPEIISKLAELYGTSSDDILGIETNTTNVKTILSNTSKLHWDGIPLHEDELKLLKQFLEIKVEERKKTLEEKKRSNGTIS